jgi:hypothetical protein
LEVPLVPGFLGIASPFNERLPWLPALKNNIPSTNYAVCAMGHKGNKGSNQASIVSNWADPGTLTIPRHKCRQAMGRRRLVYEDHIE